MYATNDDEYPHALGADEACYESVTLCWMDELRGIGGLHSIAHEPNRRPGKAIVWNTVFSRHGSYFKRLRLVDMRPDDRRADGMSGAGTTDFRFHEHAIWKLREIEADADLETEDFHRPVAGMPVQAGDRSNAFFGGQNRGRLEVAARVRGRVRVGAGTHDVDGVGFRVHSWGVRNWNRIRSHRWMSGAIDSDFAFTAFSWHMVDGTSDVRGCVIREGQPQIAERTEIIVYSDIDAVSHRGCRTRMKLAGDELLNFDIRPLCKGTTGQFHETMFALTGPCSVEVGDRRGVCIFEVSSNPMGGIETPRGALTGVYGDGLIDVPDWSVSA